MAAGNDANALRRVVLGLETSGPGGAEAMVLQLARGLQERGLSPIIATMQPGWMTERAEQQRVPVWIEPQRSGPDPLWVLRLRRRLRNERIELLHSHEFEMNAYGGAAALLAGLPSVATLHGSVAGTDRRHLLGYRVLAGLGQRQIAVSHDLARTLSERRPGLDARMQVVHNGAAVPSLATGPERDVRRARARSELGLPADGPLLVAIGNLYPVKDHATLLRAGAQLPGARIAIAGRGEEESALLHLAQDLDILHRVHLLGLRDDVGRVLAAADVFVQPSRSEGLPLSVLEAMASQTPEVATRVGGVDEAVVGGETGLLVEPGSPEALAAALRSLVDDPQQGARFAEAGWARAHQEFSVESMTERYLELYREALGA